MKEEEKLEEQLEQEILISYPEYLLVYLRRRAREWGCSLTFVIRKILVEEFMRQGVNVFKESKIDKRSASYRKTRAPYQRNPRLLNEEKPRRKTHKRKFPVLTSIGVEKPKRKRGRPPKKKPDEDPEFFPPVLSIDRIKMTGGGCSPHAHSHGKDGEPKWYKLI